MATISELTNFNMSDAIKFHKNLNPKLWDKNDHLRSEVRDQLLIIANDFIENLGIKDLNVSDITISGSNAAFTWTKHSDLDLHIVVTMHHEMQNDEVYQELFRAKKTLYNDSHDIKIHGVPVELYVQDSELPVVSLGQYSVLNDKWISIPKKQTANLDQHATKAKFEQLNDLVKLALKSKDEGKISNVLDIIRRYRQAGLAKGGEFSPENLVFKCLRTQGSINKLYDLRDKLHSVNLSLAEQDQEMFIVEQGSSLFTSQQQVINHFVKHRKPGVTASQATARACAAWNRGWRGSNAISAKNTQPATNYNRRLPYKDDLDENKLHEEWKNFKQNNIKNNGVIYNKLENKFSSLNEQISAIIQQKNMSVVAKLELIEHITFGKKLNESPFVSNIDPNKEAQIKALAASYAINNPIVGKHYIPVMCLLNSTKLMFMDSNTNYPPKTIKFGILSEISNEHYIMSFDGEIRQFPEASFNTFGIVVTFLLDSVQEYNKLRVDVSLIFDLVLPEISINEASGYIPSENQKNDPRYKTALTQDVKPDSIQQNARKLGSKISRAGIPPKANTNGKM